MISNIFNKKQVNNSIGCNDLLIQLGENKLNLGKHEALINSEVIYACVNLIANNVSRMPFVLYENTENGKVKSDNDLATILKKRPNKFMTPSAFKKYIVVQMLVYGEAFVWIKTKNGRVVELLPLDSS